MKTLDLHGKSYDDATILAETFIENCIDLLPIQIITGNSNEMKKIVLKVVQKHNLNAYSKTDYNLGCLVINNLGK